MKRTLVSILVLNLFTTAFSQSLLWRISSDKLDEDSYLYGTIHIQDKRVFAYGKEVSDAFNSSKAYAMEVVIDEIPQDEMKALMLLEKKTLKDLYSEEDYQILDKYCKEKMGMGIAIFDKMKPFFLSSQLMQMDLPKDMPLALDADFLSKARKSDKIILGIEKLKDQLGAIDKIPLEDQARMLLESIKDTNAMGNTFEMMIEAYTSFDEEALQKLFADTTLPKEFEKELLIKRNKGMAKNIAKFVKKQSTFNAVGAAHLYGEKGVVALLRKKGFTVEPVPFSFNKQ
jgi:uncharacterized protein YbaP (TraB family)